MAPPPKLNAARYRAEALARVRAFFAARNVLEVETPLLDDGASHDCHIDLFSLAAFGTTRFLQTSPEALMKRLLARGYPDIFQICKAFRRGEQGRRHNPEFTLIEWYRLGYAFRPLLEEALELCRVVAGARPAVYRPYSEVFAGATGLDPLGAPLADLLAHPAFSAAGLAAEAFPQRGEALDFLMAAVVEPALDPGAFTVVYDFPAALSSQARSQVDRPEVVHRFELFGGGMELGNGSLELRDPGEYLGRFQAENRKRVDCGQPQVPIHSGFFSDLAGGLPDCAGTALGFDRLVMLGLGATDIAEVLEFSWTDAPAQGGAR